MTENYLLQQQYLLDCGKIKSLPKKMATFIERKFGKDFDPETMCVYTGKALFKHPIGTPALEHRPKTLRMGFWREDGELMRVRDLTPAEAAWVRDEPEQFAADCKGFMKWLKKVRNK